MPNIPWLMSARTAAPPPAASEPLQPTVDAAAAPGPSVDDKIDALQHAVRELRELKASKKGTFSQRIILDSEDGAAE